MDSSTTSHRNATTAATADGEDALTPLEQEVLDEYAKLAGNLDDVSLLPSNPLADAMS